MNGRWPSDDADELSDRIRQAAVGAPGPTRAELLCAAFYVELGTRPFADAREWRRRTRNPTVRESLDVVLDASPSKGEVE